MTASFHLTDVTPLASASTLFVALDLSRTFWVAAAHAPHADKVGRHRVAPGAAAVLELIARLREQAERMLARSPLQTHTITDASPCLPSWSRRRSCAAPFLRMDQRGGGSQHRLGLFRYLDDMDEA